MTTPTHATARSLTATALPVGLLAATVLAATSLLFAVALDQGQLAAAVQAAAGDETLHEVFHDARHMLGFPCH